MIDDDLTEDYGDADFASVAAAADAALEEEAERSEPIYGGEGYGTVRRRHLLVVQPLADRSDLDPVAQGLLLDSDIREAMALAAKRLDQEAAKYRVTGYDWNLNDIEYDIPRARTLVATLVIERG